MLGMRLLKMLPAVRLSRERLDRIESRLAAIEQLLGDPMTLIRAPASLATTTINLQKPALTQHVLDIWSLVRPRDVIGGQMVRKGRDFDGGYVMLDSGLENAIVYSLGIGRDVSWDLDMARLN